MVKVVVVEPLSWKCGVVGWNNIFELISKSRHSYVGKKGPLEIFECFEWSKTSEDDYTLQKFTTPWTLYAKFTQNLKHPPPLALSIHFPWIFNYWTC